MLNFYRDLFASLCFIFFGAALAFKHPYLYFGALMCACLSRTASRKRWKDPEWAEPLYAKLGLLRVEKVRQCEDTEPEEEYGDEEEREG
jgi:hypothetical protein